MDDTTDTTETVDPARASDDSHVRQHEEDEPSKHNDDDHQHAANVRDCCDCQGTW